MWKLQGYLADRASVQSIGKGGVNDNLRELVWSNGFQLEPTPGRRTKYAIFILKQTGEVFLNGNSKLYCMFVYLQKKVFDRTQREVL